MQLFILLLQWSLVTFALPATPTGVGHSPNPSFNALGPIQTLIAVPLTDTTVTFTKITNKSPTGATQAESLVCVAKSLAQVYQNISSLGGSANPHSLVLSGAPKQNADCLSMQDMDPSDGKMLTYGIVAEALQGIALQLSTNDYAAGSFQVWNRQGGHPGWGSISMGTGTMMSSS
ncbi:MAG: hypothetical protein Q9170_001924 [Blastenia crenularia]